MIGELAPPKSTGRKRLGPPAYAQRNHLLAALRLLMESVALFSWAMIAPRTVPRSDGSGFSCLTGFGSASSPVVTSGGVDWEWQSTNGAMGQARLGDALGRNPTSAELEERPMFGGQPVANSKESLNFLKQARQAGLRKVAVWSVPQMWQCFSAYSLFSYRFQLP